MYMFVMHIYFHQSIVIRGELDKNINGCLTELKKPNIECNENDRIGYGDLSDFENGSLENIVEGPYKAIILLDGACEDKANSNHSGCFRPSYPIYQL